MAMLGSLHPGSSRRGGMKERPTRRGLAVVLGVLLVITLLGAWRWASSAGHDAGQFRYRFERPARGSVRQALEEEIAFYQTRIAQTPGRGLDLAALSGTYLRMARATGDLKWFLLAEQTAQRSLESLPYQNRGALLTLARVAEARHDFTEAIRLARTAGSNSEALSILVTSNLGQGNVADAARAADALVRQAPGLGSYALRSLVEVARGLDEEAITDLQRGIAMEEPGEAGSSAWARTLLGRLHYRRGRFASAQDLFDEALRILPQYPLALLNLAELEIREGTLRAAERHLTRVVTITRASPNVYDHAVLRGLARVHDLRGDHRRAAELRDDAEIRLRQDVTTGQFGHRRELARLLLERGRPEDIPETIGLMEQEVRVRRDAETLEVQAWALSHAGRWVEAERVIAAALRSGVRDARLFYRAAMIEQALGHAMEARRFLTLMQQTDPAFDRRARQILGVDQ
jgi:tetratricopeptide (TPR) repeat protein